MEEKIRAQAVITGRVQGVFFRKSTQETAAAHGVSGWVRNRPDGAVEAVFEGKRRDVETVLHWCRKGPPGARVDRVDASESDYTGEFSEFGISY